MKRYTEHIFENTYVDEFNILYNLAPISLKTEIDKLKDIKQSEYWHPEGNVYIHTELVVNRLHNRYHDVNLDLSGLFHDLGKIYTTEYDKENETYTAHGHEDESVKILEQYKDWVRQRGGDIEIVRYIVANHMRFKHIDEMRKNVKFDFLNNPYFEYVNKFNTADYGGTEKECKTLRDFSDDYKELENIQKEREIKKKVADKFNGNLIMDKYPYLKGKKLGDAIYNFKKLRDDFTWYVLNTSQEQIMNDFDEFLNN